MSQVLISRTKRNLIVQDLVIKNHHPVLNTLASKAECYVCSKGIHDGYPLTAKTTRTGKFLFCEKHYS